VGQGSYTIPLSKHDEYIVIEAGQQRSINADINIPGLYRMKLDYAAIDDSLYDYSVTITVNGELPYAELRNIPLKSLWEINPATFKEGLSPELKKTQGKLTQKLYDRNRYYELPLQIYLEEGVNEIAIEAGSLDVGVYALILYIERETPSYAQYKDIVTENGGHPIFIQGEYPPFRSNPSIMELVDNSSPATRPPSIDRKTINTIGGTTFSTPSDSIIWTFEIDTAGAYSLNMRVRQDFSSGSVVYRTLLIDGEVPFEECRNLKLPYSNGFSTFIPQDENGEPYYFQLEPGSHTVSLVAVLGDDAPVIREMKLIEEKLNIIYRRIIMLTSSNPDPYRDYLIDEKLPDVLEEMKKQARSLRNISDHLAYKAGGRGITNAALDKLARQLEGFYEQPETIPSLLGSFKSNTSAIGTWITEKTAQPLEIDWLEFVPKGKSGTGSPDGFFQRLVFGIRQFIRSFAGDHGGLSDAGQTIEIWTTAGRDQVLIIQRMIDESFTPEYNIGIDLKLVQPGTLLPAVVSGIGPDAAIFNLNSDAVSFASRKAAVDLTGMTGFSEISGQFHESALLPLRLEKGVYGLPEQQVFPVMFYRKDILSELGLSIPDTWDDVYNLMFELQKSNMEFAIPIGLQGYALFLYQSGGQIYNDNGSACVLDSEIGVASFKHWSRFFTDFGLNMSFNFVNRFRSGEMPIGIADYTAYNTLVVFAPEIYDLWDIACVPGTRRSDGSIDRSVPSIGTCSIMFEASKSKAAAWEFMKWWGGSRTQQRYARSIEMKLGAAARYPAANRDAFENLMWEPRQYAVLKEQMQFVKGIPEVPGGYFTARHIDFAFRQVVIHNREIREALMENIAFINVEISEKRRELGFE
jgi:ABC-type glycerol-3-phosphate transport system substrate-binding protein